MSFSAFVHIQRLLFQPAVSFCEVDFGRAFSFSAIHLKITSLPISFASGHEVQLALGISLILLTFCFISYPVGFSDLGGGCLIFGVWSCHLQKERVYYCYLLSDKRNFKGHLTASKLKVVHIYTYLKKSFIFPYWKHAFTFRSTILSPDTVIC